MQSPIRNGEGAEGQAAISPLRIYFEGRGGGSLTPGEPGCPP